MARSSRSASLNTLLNVCVSSSGSRQDLAFNVLIAKTGHELILQCPVQVFAKFAGDCSTFQTIAEIDEALCRFLDTVSEGERCCCCGSLYLIVSFEEITDLLECLFGR